MSAEDHLAELRTAELRTAELELAEVIAYAALSGQSLPSGALEAYRDARAARIAARRAERARS